MAHPLHVKSATRFRDVKITTDNSAIVTRQFPFRQKPHISTLITTGNFATGTGKAAWYTGFQIPVAQGRMGTEQGEQASAFYSVFPAQAINCGWKTQSPL